MVDTGRLACAAAVAGALALGGTASAATGMPLQQTPTDAGYLVASSADAQTVQTTVTVPTLSCGILADQGTDRGGIPDAGIFAEPTNASISALRDVVHSECINGSQQSQIQLWSDNGYVGEIVQPGQVVSFAVQDDGSDYFVTTTVDGQQGVSNSLPVDQLGDVLIGMASTGGTYYYLTDRVRFTHTFVNNEPLQAAGDALSRVWFEQDSIRWRPGQLGKATAHGSFFSIRPTLVE